MTSAAQQGSLFKAALLITGTTIGGGMLAMPVLTSPGGFGPSLLIYALCWLFMMLTGLLMLELGTWVKGDANIISMAEKTIGLPGKICAWLLYLFLFFCLTIAYMEGSGELFAELSGGLLADWQGTLLFIAIFVPFVYLGTRAVGAINILLMACLAFFYFTFVIIGFPYVKAENLQHVNWSLSLGGLPIAFTAFAYQGTVPTLMHYLHGDVVKGRKAIIYGSLAALTTYLLWQWLILGIIPTFGPGSLEEALAEGQTAVHPLKDIINAQYVYLIGQCFAFFALVTSFLGVSLGLVDFLADGLDIKKTANGKLLISLLIFVPTFIISAVYPHIFLEALNYAGGFGCALLLGLLPILMVWVGRYRKGYTSNFRVPGGKTLLGVLILFVCFELWVEFSHLIQKFS